MGVHEAVKAIWDGIKMVPEFRADLELFMIEERAKDRAKERRERIATAVLAGFAASVDEDPTREDPALAAVLWADALITELDKGNDVQVQG